jgi:hypothetical protein
MVCSQNEEKYFLSEIFAIMASARGYGFKNRKFKGFSSGKGVHKTIFDFSGQGCCIISDDLPGARVSFGGEKF